LTANTALGTGKRTIEASHLRAKDLDFTRGG
jgi:hypothetical protein